MRIVIPSDICAGSDQMPQSKDLRFRSFDDGEVHTALNCEKSTHTIPKTLHLAGGPCAPPLSTFGKPEDKVRIV